MRLVDQAEASVKGICRDWETVFSRQDFAEGRAANFAKAPLVNVRRGWLENLHAFLTPYPAEVFFFHKCNSASTNFTAP